MEPYITLFFFVTDIYESFVRPHLNFGDAVYDQLNNGSLSDITESLQYNEALTITAAVRGPLKEKLYQQKQPFRGVLRKRCSENMQQIYRRTPMPKCDFNHTSPWVFSRNFAAYFQNNFFLKHILVATSEVITLC